MGPWVHIIGGGLSGLSLAASLAQFKKLPGHVLISEPKPRSLAEKTFSFWYTDSEHKFLRPEYSSSRWTLSSGDCHVSHHGSRFEYGTRSGKHVLESALKAIDAHPQIDLVDELVRTSPMATHCFDSRPCSVDTFQLTQSFVGTEVVFEQPHGILEVRLMDCMRATDSGLQFVYLLPLGANQLLVEHTEFTSKPADFSALDRLNVSYLQQRFPDRPYRVVRNEAAHIPMGFKQQVNHLGIPIGARGGMTRDATGYGYRTIRYACQQIANQLVTDDVAQRFQGSAITKWADRLFLNLIEHRPDIIPQLLMQIANRMRPDRFAAFMMMRSPVDLIHMLRVAPAKPFTCALLGRYRWI